MHSDPVLVDLNTSTMDGLYPVRLKMAVGVSIGDELSVRDDEGSLYDARVVEIDEDRGLALFAVELNTQARRKALQGSALG